MTKIDCSFSILTKDCGFWRCVVLGSWMVQLARAPNCLTSSIRYTVGICVNSIEMISVCINPIVWDIFFSFQKGSYKGWRAPLVFALCVNKKTSTYKALFEHLKSKNSELNPKQINVDCELAAVNAAQDAFIDAKIQLCDFHIKQSVLRNLKALDGLKQRYEKDLEFSTEVRMMMALAYLPPEEVIP